MGLFKGFQSAGTARHRVMSSERGDESDFTKTAMKRAIKSHEPIDYDPDNHFRGVKKMVRLGCGAELAIKECNLIFRISCDTSVQRISLLHWGPF